MLVIDASVIVKLLKAEADSGTARAFLDEVVRRRIPAVTPSLALYETLSAALHVGHPFSKVGAFFEQLKSFGIETAEPALQELVIAERISTTRAKGGGFPDLYDSIYHAMAISRAGMFVTADARHIRKAMDFGHLIALSDWRP